MKIAVTDANIFIDLIRIDLLGHIFDLKIELHTSTYVIEELNSNQFEILEPYIKNSKIRVTTIETSFYGNENIKDASNKLSPQDLSVVFLALYLNASVLTGDNVLRKYCEKKKLLVHGILWLFDQFVENNLIDSSTAISKLELLLSINNRLPKEHCDMRFKNWR